jgi:hypothetical protein
MRHEAILSAIAKSNPYYKETESMEKTDSKAVLCGTLGAGGVSYYLLKRQSSWNGYVLQSLDGVLLETSWEATLYHI